MLYFYGKTALIEKTVPISSFRYSSKLKFILLETYVPNTLNNFRKKIKNKKF